MIRRPPRSTRVSSSAASDVYKRQHTQTHTHTHTHTHTRISFQSFSIVSPFTYRFRAAWVCQPRLFFYVDDGDHLLGGRLTLTGWSSPYVFDDIPWPHQIGSNLLNTILLSVWLWGKKNTTTIQQKTNKQTKTEREREIYSLGASVP